jgi:hypothetical protein
MAKKKSNQPLRRFHALGKLFLKASDRRQRRGIANQGTMASLEADTQAQKNRLMEARHFARLYNDRELDWICSLGQRKGRPLTRVDVLQLIRVADRRQRNALAKKCAEEEWTARKLEMEVRLHGEDMAVGVKRRLNQLRKRSSLRSGWPAVGFAGSAF